MNDSNLINSLINQDYLIKKTDEIKKLRKRLTEIRKFISDDYAEKIGSNISCIQQWPVSVGFVSNKNYDKNFFFIFKITKNIYSMKSNLKNVKNFDVII